jgi:hypothetical protein
MVPLSLTELNFDHLSGFSGGRAGLQMLGGDVYYDTAKDTNMKCCEPAPGPNACNDAYTVMWCK